MSNNTKCKLLEIACNIGFLALVILGLVVFGLIKHYCFDKTDEIPTTPVEEIRIDSIKRENNKLIIEINNLDSIKDVKAIEVKSYSNDSTLELFYKLIRQ